MNKWNSNLHSLSIFSLLEKYFLRLYLKDKCIAIKRRRQ